MRLRNTTMLDTERLRGLMIQFAGPFPLEGLFAWVRYSRGAPFSGACYYRTGRIFINLGRRNTYPFTISTHIAPARTGDGCWYREMYTVEVGDPYQLALFLFRHELYHWLVRRAGRNVRQKEGMCDRFAVRALVDGFGAVVRDSKGRGLGRAEWDIQDLEGFVAGALRGGKRVEVRSARTAAAAGHGPAVAGEAGGQLWLFGGES